jgi:hypothetical protein
VTRRSAHSGAAARAPGSRAARPSAARRATGGAVLVEVVAATALFAIAGSVVSAAAVANLRALRAATTLEYLVAIASRELAAAQAKDAAATVDVAVLDEAGVGQVHRQLVVTREPDDLATLVVAVSASDATAVTLRTRMRVLQ